MYIEDLTRVVISYEIYETSLGLAVGAGQLSVPGRPIAFAYSRARANCACSRCRTGGLYFLLHFFIYLPILMSCLLGDG